MKHCDNADCPGLERDGVPGEFRDEAVACPDCRGALAAGPRPNLPPQEFKEWVGVYQARNAVVAHLVKGAIEAEGIEVNLRGEALAPAVGELPATVLQIEVQVGVADAERARALALDLDAQFYADSDPSSE